MSLPMHTISFTVRLCQLNFTNHPNSLPDTQMSMKSLRSLKLTSRVAPDSYMEAADS